MTEYPEISAEPSRYNEDHFSLINAHYPDNTTLSICDVNADKFLSFKKMAPSILANQVWLLIVSTEDDIDPLRESIKSWTEKSGWLFVPEQKEYFSVNAGRFTWRCGIRVIEKKEVLEQLNFSGIRMIAASRFLEYQTDAWLDKFLSLCDEHQTAMYFTNNYSGHLQWLPPDFKDATILAAWHRAKRKTIGEKNQVLADRSVYTLMQKSSKLSYEVFLNRYNRRFGKKEEGFIIQQILTMDKEVREAIREGSLETLERWLSKKRYAVSGGISKLEMGLADILALPQKEMESIENT